MQAKFSLIFTLCKSNWLNRYVRGKVNIHFPDSVTNLGFTLHSELSMKKHVIKICQTAYFELKRMSWIRRFLTADATKILGTSYILSRLNYCNCLLMGAPSSLIQPLQKAQNFAARLSLMAPRHHHSTPLLKKLHWLLISERIEYKVACMSCHATSGSGPTYLSELLHIYTPSRTFRSSSDSRILKIQQYKRKTHGFRTFTCFGPYFGIHSHKTSGNAQLFHPLRRNWKLSFSSQYFRSS